MKKGLRRASHGPLPMRLAIRRQALMKKGLRHFDLFNIWT